jgi:hypothetical protein
MGDGSAERTLTLTTRRYCRVVLATLAFAISGCATTVGLGQSELREGRYVEAASNFSEHPLSSRSRRFVATSLESAVKSEQELQDARSPYGRWPYDGDTDSFLARWTW